ncbi:MAG: ABC transporter ATP-binding protein [Clostridia bacterium]|nr:ABC transporter ATP-binding protein [Clostridia bacterium]
MNIEIKDIHKKYGSKYVLNGIDLVAGAGKCIGILGGNGSGKSTLLSILAGIQTADGGSFLFDGKNLFKFSSEHSRLVGYVPQGTPLIEELTAYDNLLLWYDKAALKKELTDGLLHMLGINEFLKTTVSKMSGGMKKRLSIGCAVSGRPPVLLLDEPMAALDLACKQNISEYIKNHKKAGGIVLLATHDVLELELCDEWYIIKNGRLTRFDYNGHIEELVKNL